MKKFIYILGNLDRRIIFLLIGLAVLIPLIKPNWLELPIKIDENTKIVYDSISNLEEGDKVLLSFAYGASTKPEVHPMAVALLKHLFSKGVKVYIVSLWPEGPIMAQQALDEIPSNLFTDSQYVMFDYKVGGFVVIKGINNVEDFDFVFDFSAGVPGNAEWVQYACDPKSVPLSSGCTSIMVTDAIPYVESGQLQGILAGMPGAAEYEKLVYNYMISEQNNNHFINSDVPVSKGKANARMSSQSVAHLLMVLFIVIGNIAYYYSRREY